MELTPSTCLTQSCCCPAEQDGSIWGRCRKVWEETPRVLFAAGGIQLKELEGKKWRRRKSCISPHSPGAVPADSQTLTGAVPNPEDMRTSKASRPELKSRCPSQLQEPRSSFRGQAGSMKSSSKDQRHVQKQRALGGKGSPEFKSKGKHKPGAWGLKEYSSHSHAIFTDLFDSRAFSYRSYNYITEFLCKLLSFIN